MFYTKAKEVNLKRLNFYDILKKVKLYQQKSSSYCLGMRKSDYFLGSKREFGESFEIVLDPVSVELTRICAFVKTQKCAQKKCILLGK